MKMTTYPHISPPLGGVHPRHDCVIQGGHPSVLTQCHFFISCCSVPFSNFVFHTLAGMTIGSKSVLNSLFHHGSFLPTAFFPQVGRSAVSAMAFLLARI